jgi:putative membrane protein
MFYSLCHWGSLGFLASAGPWGWAGMILYGIFWLGIAIGMVLLLIWLIRYGSRGTTTPAGQLAPQEILQRRYAHGEISRDEYETIKRDIG